MDIKDSSILQVVPKLPGSQDGVGTYASDLAKALLADYGVASRFATGDDFALLSQSASRLMLVHYVNYGYQNRGVPFRLPPALRKLRGHGPGRLVTIFHELYASAPPWRSAFWLQPFQRGIARSIARLSDACVITSGTAFAQLRRLAPAVPISVQPVPSGFGEPVLSPAQIAGKDPGRWVICGGTALLEKSVRSFRQMLRRVPDAVSPRELFVVGGNDSQMMRAMLNDLHDVKWSYHPQVDGAVASEILSRCSFGWIDYFRHPAAPVDALFKSSVFAAFCAHGVIPVFPHRTSPLALEQDRLPGLFFVDPLSAQLPSPDERAKTGCEIYDWYQRCASLKRVARVMAEALGLAARPTLAS